MENKQSYLIYSKSTPENDFFFYKLGEIEDESIEELKTIFLKFKNLKIIVSDIKFDKVKTETNNIKFPSIHSENYFSNFSFFNKFLEEIDLDTFKKYKLNYFSFSKNLLNLEKLKFIFSQNSNSIWTNNTNDSIEFSTKLVNYKIVEDDLLFDFVSNDFSKKCYGLQIESESPYDSNTFKSYIENKINSVSKFVKKPQRCQYTFSVEKVNLDGNSKLYNYPLKISLFNFFDIHYNSNKKFDTLLEEEINFIEGYDYKEKRKIYFFLIEETLIEKLYKIKKVISEDFCIHWVDEYYFLKEFQKIKFKQTQIGEYHYTSIWSNYYLFGLELRYKEFYHRYSDFGTDNDLLVVNGDSRYLDLINKKPIYVKCNPMGTRSNSNGRIESTGKYYGLEENIFEYFFENKKFLITNIDDIHYIGYSYSDIGLEENKKGIVSKKVILIPEIMLEDSFILTQDYFPY